MMTLKGSKTEQNLLAAFAGESQARNRYSFAASVARKEGFEQISSLFLETADEEKQHAKLFFKVSVRRARLFIHAESGYSARQT